MLVLKSNPVTEKSYKGKNIEKLVDFSRRLGYTSGEFATFKQWMTLGQMVKHGQKGCRLSFYNRNEGLDIPVEFKAFTVFSREQTETIDNQCVTEYVTNLLT